LDSNSHDGPGTDVVANGAVNDVMDGGESDQPVAPRTSYGRSPKALLRAVFREERFFLILSVFIGIYSGLAVVCFRFAIDWCRLYLLGTGAVLSPTRLLLSPTLTGLVIAVLVIHVFPLARGSGVNQTKAAEYLQRIHSVSNCDQKVCYGGAGDWVGTLPGPEDPSLQIGACIASMLGRPMRLSRDRMRLIAPVGAAAGLAAAFNAPISAVLFVIEEVIGRWTAGILGSVVLSAVSSVVVMRLFLGSESLFRIPAVQLERPSELIAYAILGIVGGLASVVFSLGISTFRPKFKALPLLTSMARWWPSREGMAQPTVIFLGRQTSRACPSRSISSSAFPSSPIEAAPRACAFQPGDVNVGLRNSLQMCDTLAVP